MKPSGWLKTICMQGVRSGTLHGGIENGICAQLVTGFTFVKIAHTKYYEGKESERCVWDASSSPWLCRAMIERREVVTFDLVVAIGMLV